MKKRETVFSKDLPNKKLLVTRAFDARLAQVWNAWTISEILDQWWAPQPYRAETKIMDFREGGFWLYAMVGPKGDRSWCKETYKTIDLHKRITNFDTFCDEDGHPNVELPTMDWKKEFKATNNGTEVMIEITFAKEADLETIIKMGFQEGFTAGLSNLDHYLSTQSKLRKEII